MRTSLTSNWTESLANNMKTFFTHSLGCKVNAYETDCVASKLLEEGFERVDDPASADVIVLNTCAVTAVASKKSRQHIRSYREANPKACLLVMGCYSQDESEACASFGADIVLGSGKRQDAASLISGFLSNGEKVVSPVANSRDQKYEEFGAPSLAENARAYLKVQDGCDNFCSYCAIPRLRGNSRSRDPREAIEEAKRLCCLGYKEIVISGIHIGAYGKDLGDGSYRLPDLLDSLCSKVPGLLRIRISSIEESELDEKFLSCLRRHPQIVSHLHIPLQSGSDGVLKRMHRHYSTAQFLEKLTAIRGIRPGIAITTDLIAGFPEETEQEWGETMSFCRQAGFAEIHVFPYSLRKNTYAATLPQVDPAAKKLRVKEMLSLSKQLRKEYEEGFYGKSLPVLFETYDEAKGISYGHTENYLLVGVKGKIEPGSIEDVIYSSEVSSD